jgi:hypothetical protein
MTTADMTSRATLALGTDVEVFTSYRQTWTRGFEVYGVANDRYLLRRRSDDAVLPGSFAPAAVRPAGVPGVRAS